MGRWVVLVGERQIQLEDGDVYIGRSSSCAVEIDDGVASRQHAVLQVGPSSISVEDLGSRNGTLVDGRLIGSRTTLTGGARITIGSTLLTIYDRGEQSRTPRPTPQTPVPVPLARVSPASPATAGGAASPSASVRTRTALPDHLLVDRATEALARGAVDECAGAISIVSRRLGNQGTRAPQAILAEVCRILVELARLRGDRGWIEGVFRLHTSAQRVIAAELVDAIDDLPPIGTVRAIDEYLDRMRDRSQHLSEVERTTLARVARLSG